MLWKKPYLLVGVGISEDNVSRTGVDVGERVENVCKKVRE